MAKSIIETNENEVYLSPFVKLEKGKAPGMQVQLLSENNGRKEYAVIFKKGDEAFLGLHEFAEQYQITAASFTAIGASSDITLGWFCPERKMYKKLPSQGQVEISSLFGNIAVLNDKSLVHAHAVVSFPDGTTRAGHLLGLTVLPTLEVMVVVEPTTLRKRIDQEIGIAVIDPSLTK